MEDLILQILGSLDIEKTADNINTQLESLSGKLDNLKLSFGIDKEILNVFRDFTKSMENIKAMIEELNKVTKTEIEITKQQDGTIQTIQKDYLKSGEIIERTTTQINKQTEANEQNTASINQQNKALEANIQLTETLSKIKERYTNSKLTDTTYTYQQGIITRNITKPSDNNQILETTIVDLQKLQKELTKVGEISSSVPNKESETYQTLLKTYQDLNIQLEKYITQQNILSKEELTSFYGNIAKLKADFEGLITQEEETARLMSYGTKMNIPYMGLDDNAIKRYAQSIYGVETEIRNLSKIMEDGDSRIRTFVARIKEADGTFREMKVTVDEATQSLYHGIEQTGNLAGKDIGLIGALKVAFERFPVWLVASTAVMGAVHQIRDAVAEVQELNKAQTNIQMITGATAQQTQEWTKQLSNLSTQLHDTTLNVMQASEEFLRAGRGIEETQKLIEASTVMSKISGQTQEETAQQLIAIQNAYKMSAQQMMDVVDKLTTVDNATSTSTKELGIALEHTAATAQQAGVSFDKLVSYIATVSSVTRRSASTIGDSMRSIFARIESIREGKQFDPEGNPLNNVEKALNRVGIALRDTSNSFRNISDVFDELAAKWNKLNDVEKNEIATAIAGVYQRENFLTLMQHYNEALDLQAKMTDSAGSALKRYDAYTQSIEAHLNDLTNAGQRLWMDALNSETINNFISILTGLVNLLDAAVKEFGLLPPAISATSVAFFAFNKELRDTISTSVVNFFVNLKNSLSGVTVAAEEATAAIETTNAVAKGLSVGSILATLGGGIVAGIAGFAIGELIQYIINSIERAKQEEEAFKKQNDEMVQAYRNNANTIDILIAKYEELSKKATLNNDEQKQLIVVQNELNKLMPNLAEKIDEQGNAHLKNTDAVKRELEYTKQLLELQNKEKIATFEKDLSDQFNQIEKIQSRIAQLRNSINGYNSLPDTVKNEPMYFEAYIKDERELLEQQQKLVEAENKVIDTVRNATNIYIQLKDANNLLTDSDKKYINSLIEQNKNVIKNTETGKQFYDNLTKQIDGIIAVRDALSKMSDEANNNTAIIKKATDILRQHGMNADAVSQYIAILTDTVGQLTDSANNELQNIALLTDAINKLRNGYSLTQEDIAKLVVKYPDLIDKYTEENGVIKIDIQALEDKRKAEISAFNTTIQALEKQIEARKQYLAAALPLYEKEIMAIKDVASAQQIANNIKNAAILDMARKSGSMYLGGKLGDIYGSFSDSFVQIGQALEDLNNLKGSLNSVGSGLKDITKNLNDGYIPAAEKASKATKSAADNMESVQAYVIDEFSHKLAQLDLQLEQSKVRLESYDKTSQEYRNELQAQNVLLEQKKVLIRDEINSLTSVNNALLSQINVLKQHNKLTTEQQKQLNDLLKEYDDNLKKIEEYNKSIIDLDSNIQRNTKDIYQTWLDNATNIANQVVEAYKAALQKERDLTLRAKDDELKAEEERHKAVMDSLDKELKQYEDIINAKLKLIDMESNERDYNSQLSDLEQQRADIQKQINVLSLDDSVEAQAKLADLKQKEADIEKKIDDLKYKHTQDLRKQNLQNELDSYKQQIDAKKQAENDMYQANKDRIDREKQLIEAHYEDLLNDTQKFESMRQQIIAGNIQQISEILKNYLDTFNKLMHDSIQQNGEDLLGLLGLIQQIQAAQTGLGSLGIPPTSTFHTGGTTYPSGTQSQQPQTPLAVISPSQYKIDSTGSAIMPSRALASILGKSASWDAESGMVIIGDKKFIPSLIDTNGTSYLPIRVVAAAFGHRVEYDKLTGKISIFDTGGYTGKFDGGRLAILHEKELVLNKEDTFNILKVVDITRNMIKSLETLKLPPLSLVGTGNVFNIDIHIDKVEGNENGANVLLHEFVNGLRKKGVRLA